MKTITLANRKGGVGKSTIALQYAYYLNLKVGLRVVIIDLDDQANTTDALSRAGIASISSTPSPALLTEPGVTVESNEFLSIPAEDNTLRSLESLPDQHNIFATNLRANLSAISSQFDVCVIDTSPSPDIRLLSALVSSDYVISPVQLSQESLSGIDKLLNHPSIGINVIRDKLNPRLTFIGALPNMVEKTPFQQAGLKQLVDGLGQILIRTTGGFALIPKSTAILEAQAAGLPVWQLGKTSARDVWTKHLQPTCTAIADQMKINEE